MRERITLTRGDHTVTTTVPTEAVTLEAHGYTRVLPGKQADEPPAEKPGKQADEPPAEAKKTDTKKS